MKYSATNSVFIFCNYFFPDAHKIFHLFLILMHFEKKPLVWILSLILLRTTMSPFNLEAQIFFLIRKVFFYYIVNCCLHLIILINIKEMSPVCALPVLTNFHQFFFSLLWTFQICSLHLCSDTSHLLPFDAAFNA